MAQYKGVELATDVAGLIRHMEGVDATREALQRLQGVWDNLAMLGQLSGNGVEIAGVRSAFGGLTSRLLDQLAGESRRKAALALRAQAQVAIDILVRNLFERTADIGFLATDGGLRQFAETEAAARDRSRPALIERLREYQRKYSVYGDVVLLDPAGDVLARLLPCETPATRDGLVAEALTTRQAYVERFGPFDLLPGSERSLVYASRVMSADGRRAVGVLCLCFRFDDECRRIFAALRGAGDWGVLTVLDGSGRVIASSDALQAPPGAAVAGECRPGGARELAGPDAADRCLRFGGRRWLAATCTANAYQGYAGPGWFGHAMVPIEQAFDAGDMPAELPWPAAMLNALTASPLLFSEGLRDIPRAAQAIETELQRAVWNGNVALASAAGGRDGAFSKVLLREIGQTGARTRDVFTRAIADINHTVISAALDHARARAALAIDILDRNLYERANDCRWWALTAVFRRALDAGGEGGGPGAASRAELAAILQTIHGLYTVYANLVLFDRAGRVVASSRADGAAAPGRVLGAEWVQRTFALHDTQAFAESAFEPSPLYGDRPTCIHSAAVRSLDDPRRVVGGIAIVFDAALQFEAMLADTLPRGEDGAVVPGAVNLFVNRSGRVIAHSRAEAEVAERLARADLPAGPFGARTSRLVAWGGRLWALGTSPSAGYREYTGMGDRGRSDVSALALVPLADANAAGEAVPPAPARQDFARRPVGTGIAAAASGGTDRIDLATFVVAGQWYGVAGTDVVEAVGARHILPLPGRAAHVRGSVMHAARPVLVLDLGSLLGFAPAVAGAGHIVIVRVAERGPCLGLWVDSLGDNPAVERSALEPFGGTGSLIDHIVKAGVGEPGDDLLKLLSVPRLAATAFGMPGARTARASAPCHVR